MKKQDYLKIVRSIKIGKRLPDAVYLHKSALKCLPEPLMDFLESRLKTDIETTPWNLIKLFKREFKVSLLNYPEFYKDAFPALEISHSIDLQTLACKKIHPSCTGKKHF